MSDFANLLNEESLLRLAGERAFERGEEYFADGHVIGLKEETGTISAGVRGTYYYRVKLWAKDEDLAFQCNCPVGQDQAFCKHCVAVGLAWLDRRNRKGEVSDQLAKREMTDEEIREHLMEQDKDALVRLLMHQAEWNSEFRDRLVLEMAHKGAKPPDLAIFRTAIDKAIRNRGSVAYARMPEYARGIEAVIDSLDSLLERGHAIEVRELVERALERLESAMDQVDDSDGFMGGILERLQELHLSACCVAKPDPSALAQFLFEWEVTSAWEIFLGAARDYADVLGNTGLARYRKLAEAKWAGVPSLAPGEKDPERYAGRWRITHIMETIAKQSDDIEALVAVKSRDLSEAFSFLDIALIYRAAGNDEAALEWAERGARAFSANADSRLREFLIEEYHKRKRHSEAITITWTSFRERPGLDAYQVLHKSACHAKQWPEWREKAIALLREKIVARKEQPPRSEWGSPARADHSDLVQIYLWEADVETAWQEAKIGGCRDALWFRLAEAREKEHPADAIAVYTEQLKPILQLAEPSAYENAIEILRKIRKLMGQVGKEREFVALVQSIRAQHKPRRNLMKLLDVEGW
ncbi:MAG: DUF6880 family protein [Candidatus Acidiferrum sp.]